MNQPQKPARVRFAPSPTGHLHLGGARTALYDYLLARQTGGQFILRIEDTDQKRLVPGSESELLNSLRWLGLDWDEGVDVGGPYGPYRQSERRDIYQEYAHKLIDMDRAYYCFCSPERLETVRQQQKQLKLSPRYDGTCRKLDPDEAAARVARGERHVIRFKMPQEGSITVHEALRGDITVENQNLDDYVIVKSDGLALYHLASMLDDHLMNVTHVIRGSEWLSTLPLHAHILRSFGWEEPEWVHLSVFLKPSGKGKMSKREAADLKQDGHSIFVKDLEDLGYLPEAVVNWISLMGWSYDGHTEYFTLPDLVEKFSLDRLNPSPAAINFTKLDHFNGLHIRNLSDEDLAQRIKPFFERAGIATNDQKLIEIAPLVRLRLGSLDEVVDMAGFFFADTVTPGPDDLVGKKMTPAQALEVLRRATPIIENLPDFSHESADAPLRALAEEMALNAGQFFGVLRSAITGQTVSPPLFESMTIIGKQKVLERLHNAEVILEKVAA